MTPETEPLKALKGPLGARVVRSLFRVLWFGCVPALSAVVCSRYLIAGPTDVDLGPIDAALAHLGSTHPVEIGVLFFLLFAVLVRKWQTLLPGGEYLLPLPLALASRIQVKDAPDYEAAIATHRVLSVALARGNSALSKERADAFREHLGALETSIATGDVDAVRARTSSARTLAAEFVASADRREGAALALGIVAAALMALSLRNSVVGLYRVESGSMLPSFRPGDHVLVNQLRYGFRAPLSAARAGARIPHRGDVIVFGREGDEGYGENIKRVVGLPGDHITMDGLFPIINGWKVPSCSAGPYTYLTGGTRAAGRLRVEFLGDQVYLVLFGIVAPELEGEVVVGPSEVFVLGDNRSDSKDSRSYNSGFGGGIAVSAIEGRVERIAYGLRNDGTVDLEHALRALGTNFVLEGMSTKQLEEHIRLCLEKRPKNTVPPSPGARDPGAAAFTEARP